MLHSLLTVNVISRKELNMDMNIKKVTALGISAILAVMQCACSSETEEEDNYAIQTPDNVVMNTTRNFYENGLIYEADDTAYFLEYDSFQGTTLCNKPNCTHSDGSCIGQIVTKGGTPPVVYQDDVYYFEETDGIVESEDGTETTYEITCTLKRISLSSGTSEEVCEFAGMDATYYDTVYLSGNTLYFIASNGALQSEDGGWSYYSAAGKQYLCSVNLETGDFEDYGLINDNPYAENSLFCVEGSFYNMNSMVTMCGVYQNKIFFSYTCAETSEEIYDAFLEKGSMPGDDDVDWIYEVRAFDLETLEFCDTDLPYPVAVEEGYYLYWDDESGVYIVLDENGTETQLDGFEETFLPDIVNGKVWASEPNISYYDLTTGEITSCQNSKYQDCGAEVETFVDGQYIVQYMDESGATSFDMVDESELLGDT